APGTLNGGMFLGHFSVGQPQRVGWMTAEGGAPGEREFTHLPVKKPAGKVGRARAGPDGGQWGEGLTARRTGRRPGVGQRRSTSGASRGHRSKTWCRGASRSPTPG